MKNLNLRVLGRPVGHNNSKSFNFSSQRPPSINLVGGSGDIRVNTHEGQDIRVELSWFGINTEWIGDTVNVQFDATTGQLLIDADSHEHIPPPDFAPSGPVLGMIRKPKSSEGGGVFMFATSIDIDIYIPHGTSVSGVTRSGDWVMSGDFAGISVTATSGDIRVSATDETATIPSAIITTSSGDIACRAQIEDVIAAAHSGDVSIDRATRAEVTTTSGDIEIGVVRGKSPGQIHCNAKSGDVIVRVAQGLSVDLDLGTKRGEIVNAISLDADSFENSTESPVDCHIVIRTSSGDVRIKKSLL